MPYFRFEVLLVRQSIRRHALHSYQSPLRPHPVQTQLLMKLSETQKKSQVYDINKHVYYVPGPVITLFFFSWTQCEVPQLRTIIARCCGKGNFSLFRVIIRHVCWYRKHVIWDHSQVWWNILDDRHVWLTSDDSQAEGCWTDGKSWNLVLIHTAFFFS